MQALLCPFRMWDAFTVVRRPSLEVGQWKNLSTLSLELFPCMYTVPCLATTLLARDSDLLFGQMERYSA